MLLSEFAPDLLPPLDVSAASLTSARAVVFLTLISISFFIAAMPKRASGLPRRFYSGGVPCGPLSRAGPGAEIRKVTASFSLGRDSTGAQAGNRVDSVFASPGAS